MTSESVVVPCLASPLGEELFSEGGNADFKYNSMESDDDMLDDMLDDMDLDEMLDDAIESVTAQEEREDDNLVLMKITDTLDLNACKSLGDMREWKEWDTVIRQDMLKQQGFGRKKPFSRAYCYGMSPKQRAQHRILKGKRVGLISVDRTFGNLLSNALVHSKVCNDDAAAQSLLGKIYNDSRTEKYMKKIEGGYVFRFNSLMKERLNGDSDFNRNQFPKAAAAFCSQPR